MTRIFVPAGSVSDGRLRIEGAELRHLRTIRLRPGDRFVAFDDSGIEHTIRLDRIDRRAAEGSIERSVTISRESPLDVTLVPAVLKGPRMDVVVEKATELGVRTIAPALTARCVAGSGHVARWQRIALAAAKQSGRTRVTIVDEPAPLAARLAHPWRGLRLFAWEDAPGRGWDDLPRSADHVVVLLGPEGGFTADEAAAALQAGFHPVSLGARILRAETAAVAAAVLCQHRWGDG